uniref:Uncharacterized protein n=1 Tax=Anguilla anguilla TaxID=7936 RepID=A0A0E9S6U0_ANGAN
MTSPQHYHEVSRARTSNRFSSKTVLLSEGL